MAQVTVTVNGRSYKMGCREGEQSRVQELASEIDGHIRQIKGTARAVPDDRLLLMAAIMVADQLHEAREELQRSLKQMAEFRSYQVIDGGTYVAQRDAGRAAEQAAQKLEALTSRSG